MLKMPIVHTPPPAYAPVAWHHTAAPVDQFKQVDQSSTLNQPRLFSPLLSFTYTLLFASFLALSGCKKFDKLVGASKAEPTSTNTMQTLSDSDLFVGTSRTVRLKPNRQLSKRMRSKLEGEAYRRSKTLIAKDVKQRIRQAFPIDCRGHKVDFTPDWNHLSYQLETVRTLGNGTRMVRIQCKLTWERAWCQRRYSGNRAKGISGSKIPYSIYNPALK